MNLATLNVVSLDEGGTLIIGSGSDSGGGGGSGDGGSNWRYFDLTSYSENQKGSVWAQFAMIAAVGGDIANMLGVSTLFVGAGFAFQTPKDVKAVAYDANATVGAEGMSMQQQVESSPYWAEMASSEITKEQFYTL